MASVSKSANHDTASTGLDSQTAWSICTLLRKLADNGQAILCTIHQPSTHLFQVFDRLLLLAMGGKTLYFGEIGTSAQTVTSYFERNGARPCKQDENPAEWMLEVTGAASGSETETKQDWFAIWNRSEEHRAVKAELALMKGNFSHQPSSITDSRDPDALRPFAATFGTQLASGAAKPDVCNFHAAGNIYQCLLANHASLRFPEKSL